MATSNERLRSGVLSHQIGLIRVSNNLRRRVLSFLDRSERQVKRSVAVSMLSMASDDGSNIPLDPMTMKRLAKVQANIKKARSPAFQSIQSAMKSELVSVAVGEPEFMTSLIRSVSPVDLPITSPDLNELSKIVTSRPFQGRLLREWTSKISADERSRIMNEIRIGLSQGMNARQITLNVVGTVSARSSNGATKMTRAHIQTLVRTAISHIGAAARREFALANKRLFSKEQWISVLDGRTSTICLSLNGKLFEIGKGQYPPAHLNCRSIRAPFISVTEAVRHKVPADTVRKLVKQFAREKGLGRLTSRRQLSRTNKIAFDAFLRGWVRKQVGARPKVMSTADFLSGLSMDQLEDVLGVTKARLMTIGDLPLGRLVDREGSPLSLVELAAKEAKAFKKAGLNPDDFDL